MDELNGWFVWGVVAVGALIGLIVGNTKHRALAGLVWGAILGPIGWLLVGLGPDAAERQAKRCPYCLGLIPVNQGACAHCKQRVVWVRGEPRKPSGAAVSISQ